MLFGEIHTIQSYVIDGDSMAPIYPNGVVLDKICIDYPFEKLQVGDIVVFRSNGFIAEDNWYKGDARLNTIHQIVRRDLWGHWKTKGINNDSEDIGCLTRDNFVGKLLN
jgi:hypothetical protein